MARIRFPRNWPLLAALILLVLLTGGWVALARGKSRTSSVSVEIVYSQPLQASHAMPTGLAPLPEPGADQPRIEIPSAFYDFGAISSQAVVQRDFLLINRGSAPLIIQQAYTTCGCTTAKLTASVIPPGKASRATIIFNAGFHPVAGQTVRRGLVLETNDPSHPEAEIWVQASVIK